MFSFHRPKVYRSSTGCCICKAKSSSSRFTDSKKYEEDFLECFKLATPRQGEICNACVLLVKRWKKLPAGSDRNWKHVVDARAGPGMKSMTKFKSRIMKGGGGGAMEKIKKKSYEREYSPTPSDKSDGGEMADVDFMEDDEGAPSGGSSRTASPSADCEGETMGGRRRKKKGRAKKREIYPHDVGDFIDYSYWKREVICCGAIYKGLRGEVMVDPMFLRPCEALMRLKDQQPEKPKCDNHVVENGINTTSSTAALPAKTFSDSSSDSGYDESSNQGLNSDNTAFKKGQISIDEINSRQSMKTN